MNELQLWVLDEKLTACTIPSYVAGVTEQTFTVAVSSDIEPWSNGTVIVKFFKEDRETLVQAECWAGEYFYLFSGNIPDEMLERAGTFRLNVRCTNNENFLVTKDMLIAVQEN